MPIILLYSFQISNVSIKIVMIVFSLLTVLAIDFHLLEMFLKEKNKSFKINYPNKLIDTTLYVFMIFMSEALEPSVYALFVLIMAILRLSLTYIVSFYLNHYQQYHRYYIVINIISSIAIYMAINFTQSGTFLITLLFIMILCLVLKKRILSLLSKKV